MIRGVEVDDSDLRRDMARLGSGIEAGVDRGAMQEATRTADQLREALPKRSGRLAATVGPVRVDGGAAVTYGGALPYAAYIERRTHAVAAAVHAGTARFPRAMADVAETETRKL